MKILMENALESWAKAIQYCDEIMDGKATLANRKCFVSFLQNSVELFVKQHMLNVNDHVVMSIKKSKRNDEPFKTYLSSNNLNEYFSNIRTDKTTMENFHSIGFEDLKTKQSDLFVNFYKNSPYDDISSTLGILQDLRNNETHFYIDADDFLNEKQFEKLHNMMVIFYKILEYYHLLPFFGEVFSEYQRFSFNRSELTDFSYENQLQKSDFVKKLKNEIENVMFPTAPSSAPYLIAEDIIIHCKAYSEQDFNELWEFIQMLLKYEMLEIIDESTEVLLDGQTMYTPCTAYKIKL